MPTPSAQFKDIDALIENFKEGEPYFIITDYQGNILKRNEKIDDIEESAELIRSYFKGIDKYSQVVYCIKQFSEVPKGGIKKVCEPDTISTYKLPKAYSNEDNEGQPQQRGGYYMGAMLDEVRQMRQEVALLKAQIEESEDDSEVENQAEPTNYLGAILGNPAIMQVLTNLLTNITANIATPHIQAAAPGFNAPRAMAGVCDEFETVWTQLQNKGVRISDLQILASKTQDEINFLLNLLRK
jgi:hypothetical protein